MFGRLCCCFCGCCSACSRCLTRPRHVPWKTKVWRTLYCRSCTLQPMPVSKAHCSLPPVQQQTLAHGMCLGTCWWRTAGVRLPSIHSAPRAPEVRYLHALRFCASTPPYGFRLKCNFFAGKLDRSMQAASTLDRTWGCFPSLNPCASGCVCH